MEAVKKELSHRQFLINLQLEYLTHKLRSLIYRDKVYADVALDIAEKKKKKIIELSKKFRVTTIFSPGFNVTDFVSKYFWQPYGLPKFQYKDEEQRRVQGNYDSWYIYFRNSEVIYKGEKAIVLRNDPSHQELSILVGKEKIDVSYIDVSLINKYNWI